MGVDARSPRFDGGIVTRVDAAPFGIVVNRDGKRFYDEGEAFWPKRYAIWGRLIAEQPGQVAFAILDEKVRSLFIPSVYPPLKAGTIGTLATEVGLSPEALVATVDEFNAAVAGDRPFDPEILDGRLTRGLTPTKSNWAQAIDTPQFYAYPLVPGITFTYFGVRVDATTRVVHHDLTPFSNATVEVMAGNILTHGYMAGIGLTIGTVFGRIAGREAAGAAAHAV